MANVNDPPSSMDSPPNSSSAASVQPISSSISLPLPITKLTEKNYLTWSQFMLAVLKANRVLRFVLQSDFPPQFLSESDRLHHRINPLFLSWEEQDQTVFSWLLNSISESLQPRVIGCTSSFQLWHELLSFCNAHTKVRNRQLRAQLRTVS
ncbi:hypothetical protein Lalb_Chr01g0011111 [Lupinus albus]|uniref:Retrotransposon Copia-like N-terminal domain-containing protein n=1 Tax=Lupinus albus TaxID=3870 RepID=A0A6A4R2Z2_LUPAL|nr:hypothetical protein Lalb_Chr01g0011111 [Lupinus albus]